MARQWMAVLATLYLALGSVGVHAQSDTGAAGAAVAATNLLRERLPTGTALVIVPDTAGDTALAVAVGKALRLPVRTAEEGRSCKGFIPRCPWSPGEGIVAVRVTALSVGSDSVRLEVDHWTVTSRQQSAARSPKVVQFARYHVLVGRVGGRWLVLRIDPEFTT